MLLENITMADFKNGLKKAKTLIIPFGTIEEHGSHLPLSTDTIQVYEVVKEAAKRAPAFVAPPLHYGVLTSTRQHPGSIGISADSLRLIARDIIKSAYSKGLRKFLLISGHAGSIHMSALREIGEELIDEIKNSKLIIMGHEHPAIGLKEKAKYEVFKCFLVGKFRNNTLIVLPSFNNLTIGTDVLRQKLLSPFLQDNLRNFSAFIVEDNKVLDFGKLKNLTNDIN